MRFCGNSLFSTSVEQRRDCRLSPRPDTRTVLVHAAAVATSGNRRNRQPARYDRLDVQSLSPIPSPDSPWGAPRRHRRDRARGGGTTPAPTDHRHVSTPSCTVLASPPGPSLLTGRELTGQRQGLHALAYGDRCSNEPAWEYGRWTTATSCRSSTRCRTRTTPHFRRRTTPRICLPARTAPARARPAPKTPGSCRPDLQFSVGVVGNPRVHGRQRRAVQPGGRVRRRRRRHERGPATGRTDALRRWRRWNCGRAICA